MKRFLKEFIKRIIVLLLVIAQLLPVYNIPAAHAADKKDSKIRFNDFYGEVKIRPDSEEDDSYEFVDLDTIIYEGDRIKTEEDSGAILGLEDMSTYVIKPESTLIIHTDEGNVSKIEMLAGSMWGNIKKMAEGKSLEVEMSQCVCGINGTTVKFEEQVVPQKGNNSEDNNSDDNSIYIDGIDDLDSGNDDDDDDQTDNNGQSNNNDDQSNNNGQSNNDEIGEKVTNSGNVVVATFTPKTLQKIPIPHIGKNTSSSTKTKVIVGGKEFSVIKINSKNDSVNKNVAAKTVKVKKNNVIVKKLTKSDLKKNKKNKKR